MTKRDVNLKLNNIKWFCYFCPAIFRSFCLKVCGIIIAIKNRYILFDQDEKTLYIHNFTTDMHPFIIFCFPVRVKYSIKQRGKSLLPIRFGTWGYWRTQPCKNKTKNLCWIFSLLFFLLCRAWGSWAWKDNNNNSGREKCCKWGNPVSEKSKTISGCIRIQGDEQRGKRYGPDAGDNHSDRSSGKRWQHVCRANQPIRNMEWIVLRKYWLRE